MKIAILSRGEELYSTKSLNKEGLKREHFIQVIDHNHCSLSIDSGKPFVHFYGEAVEGLDAIIPRIGASDSYYGASVVRQFMAMGIFSVNSPEGILNCSDKWVSFQKTAIHKIPVPKTLLSSYFVAEEQLKTFQGKPVIIKLLEGTHGEGVILAETPQTALSIIETLNVANVRFLLQEYIEESKGADIRAIVVDGVVVAAMKRQSKKGEFRSNLHRGGSAVPIKLSVEEEKIAIKAAKALNLGFCGVDILQSKNGPLILEINSTPGLEGIEKTTGINISKSVIGYIERNRKK